MLKRKGLQLRGRAGSEEVGGNGEIEPLPLMGVMLYAQKGHGRRSDSITCIITFCDVGWRFISPFAKKGLFRMTRCGGCSKSMLFVKKNTKERFGRLAGHGLSPKLVFGNASKGNPRQSTS